VDTCVLSPRHLDGCLIASLPDQIDVTNAAGVQQHLLFLLTRRVRVLIADGSATTFCDVAGARALACAAQAASARQASFRLVAPAPRLRRVLTLTGSDRLLHLYPDLAAALPPAAAWTKREAGEGGGPDHRRGHAAPGLRRAGGRGATRRTGHDRGRGG
jgi:anti-anti-sigma factor